MCDSGAKYILAGWLGLDVTSAVLKRGRTLLSAERERDEREKE